MSRSSRQRDALTPSLFPFLAVLLCTMGALVLILMLVVSGAQASALHIAEQSVHQAEEVESQLKLARHGFQKQLTEAQIDLEKKRLGLQHLENHIQELLSELEQLQRTVELADADEKSEDVDQQARAAAITDLEKQLLEAHDKLKQKLDKPEGDKPIFAIVPYDGPNGTFRRPIYLECTEQGIRIQPEGVLLKVADLEPPYGPGNPLDAALRTIRAQYAPANQAVTSTAYPLLIVRPSGIRSYAMARAAMSGWDDQFGYELVGEEVDLTFPEGDPGLASKITQALNLARERQAALIVAMPQKYRGMSERDRPLTGGSGGSDSSGYGSGGYGADDYGSGDDPARQYASGSSDSSASNFAATGNSGGGRPAAGRRGGWASDNFGDLSAGGDGLQSQPTANASAHSADSLLGFGGTAANAAPADGDAGGPGKNGAGDSFFGTASGPNDPAGGSYGPGSSPGSGPGSGYASAADSSRGAGGAMSTGAAGDPASDSLASAGGSSSASGSASVNSPSTGGGSSAGAAGAHSSGSQMSGQAPGGNQMAMPFKVPGQVADGSQASSSGSSANDSATSSGNMSSGSQGGSGSSSQPSTDTSDQQGSPQLSLDKTFNGQKQEAVAPVASRRGRGWAWSQGPRTQTPVGRSIRMQCLEDRWIVLPDSGQANDPAAVTIAFDTTPQQRAEKLAKVVAERVDSWGLALTGGYWKPVLVVDVGAGAEWRFNQLQQLLDASGLEIQRGK